LHPAAMIADRLEAAAPIAPANYFNSISKA
jgi:hypothetical protein